MLLRMMPQFSGAKIQANNFALEILAVEIARSANYQGLDPKARELKAPMAEGVALSACL